MKYLGLIPGKQKNVGDQEYGWDYGRMTLDGKKYICLLYTSDAADE